jgi:hypothetical protein
MTTPEGLDPSIRSRKIVFEADVPGMPVPQVAPRIGPGPAA